MQKPVLSVIVCTYNREKYIGECLKRLANQTIDKSKYEVIVVNNCSTDNTQNVIDRAVKAYPEIDFRLFLEEKQGLTFARNLGIQKSRGSILSFIDDDAFANQHFCEKIIIFFDSHPHASALGGKISPVYESVEPKWMSKYLLPLVAAVDFGKQNRLYKGTKFPLGANMAFRKSIFGRYGVFDINLGRRGEKLEGGEEKEMFYRLKKNKEEIWYVPHIVVDHIIPSYRVQMPYIKSLAEGVGISEKKRLAREAKYKIIIKAISEIWKMAGTAVLSIIYFFKGSPSKAWMLIRFRCWVIYSLIFSKT